MSKTPEELAEEYANSCLTTNAYILSKDAFLAGYKAAQEHAHAALEEAEARMEEIKDQVAGVSKMMPQWISVKDRLPEDASDVLIAWADGVSEACFCDETWCREGRRLLWVTHWMPLPAPPKEEE
jgi:hypothetical protein